MKKPVFALLATALASAAACAAPPAGIPGDIDASKAIQFLYGHSSVKTDDGSQYTLWRNIQTPKGGDAGDSDSGIIEELWVSAIFEHKYSEGGKEKYVVLVQAQEREWVESGGCHPCAPAIGAAIFSKTDDQWVLEAENKFMDPLGGSFGAWSGTVKLVSIGPRKYGLQHGSGYMAQGCVSEFFSILVPRKGSIDAFGVGEPKESCPDAEKEGVSTGNYDLTLRFDTASKGEYYDVELRYKSAGENTKPVTITEKYRFDGSAYKPF